MTRRTRTLIFGLLAVLAAGVALYSVTFAYFRAEEVAKAQARLSLFRGSLVAEVERFEHLTAVLSADPFVIRAARGSGREALNTRLESFADLAGLEAIYLLTPEGLTVAASNHAQEVSFLGQNYGFRPYFKDAVAGGHGTFYGIGATSRLPGYFIADPVRGQAGDVIGVIAIKIELGSLEQSWGESGAQVIVANADGIVLLASDPAWRYRALAPIPEDRKEAIRAGQQFAGEPLTALDWTPGTDSRATLGGTDYIHVTAQGLPHGWEVHYFADPRPASTRAWLAVVIAAVIAALALVATQLRRNRKIGAALRRSEAEEAELREANARLAVEIEERRTAERRLRRTQGELARASKLAALGQLAASVTHELGQPIAAMKNHLAAAELTARSAPPRVFKQVGELVHRMEDITRQLKFFAGPGTDEITKVDLRGVLNEAIALVQPNLDTVRVALTVDFPDHPVWVRGNKLRLEQVATNLLRNAVEAMAEAPQRLLDASVVTEGAHARLELRDSGHGLDGRSLENLQEPFVTTRASGQGMGLGLSISSEIVKEHGGTMEACDRPGGGARFTVTLPLDLAQSEAAQ